MFRQISMAMLLSLALASCNDAETAQITQGGNEIGPTTIKAVDERAVPVPAVRNVMESDARPITPPEAEQVPAQ